MILSIIIVSYNTAHLTVQAVKSAWEDAQNSHLLKDQTEIIVIDNNSTDDSVEKLTKLTKSIKNLSIIKKAKNLGFAKANNIGIKQATGDNILLLNSDTIVQPTALEQLTSQIALYPTNPSTAQLESRQDTLDKLGILAATLINQDGTLQPQGGSFPGLISLFCHMTMLDDIPLIGKLLPSTQHTGLRQVEKLRNKMGELRLIQRDWVGATAVLIRREVFDEVGLLEEGIFMYGEDVEFCMRAKHHHWDVAIHPTAQVIHLGSASGSSSKALIGELKGYQYIWSKHKPLWQQPIATLILKWGALQRMLVFGTMARDKKKFAAYGEALSQL